MKITILTLFPELFDNVFNSSIIGRAQKKNLLKIRTVNIRDFASDKHKSVDDKPYGGGTGMIMKVNILDKAIQSVKFNNITIKQYNNKSIKERVVLMDPKGKMFNQAKAREYSKLDHLILICGHYEGVDDRLKHFADEKISIGDYILTGGEIAAMAVTDAVSRLIKGVLKPDAAAKESFSEENILEAPQYTRPFEYRKYKVPKVLLSGNHKEIEAWKEKHKSLK